VQGRQALTANEILGPSAVRLLSVEPDRAAMLMALQGHPIRFPKDLKFHQTATVPRRLREGRTAVGALAFHGLEKPQTNAPSQ